MLRNKIIIHHYLVAYSLAVICSILAGAVEAISCPLERTQVLLQSPKYNQRYQNTGHAFKELAKVICLSAINRLREIVFIILIV